VGKIKSLMFIYLALVNFKKRTNEVLGASMKTIFMTITGAYGIRNIFRSDAFKILNSEKDLRIVIFTPFVNGKSIIADFPEIQNANNVVLEDLARYKPNLIERVLRRAAEIVFFNINYISTVKAKELELKHKSYSDYLLNKLVKKILGKNRNLIIAFEKLDMVLFRFKLGRYKEPFEKYKPTLVFATDFLHPYEWGLKKTAKLLKVPIISMIANWDHLTKRMLQKSDKVIGWDEFNRKQLIEYYGYDPKDILIAGIPHQDYFWRGKLMSKKEFLQKLGVNEKKKLITYTSAKTSLDEPEIIEIICKAIKNGEIKYPAHVHVRIHPEDNPNRYKQLFEKYKDIVTFEIPKKTVKERFWSGKMFMADTVERGKVWVPDDEEMIHYANLIASSDVEVNVASSVTLDAAALDVPIINIAFDGYQKRKLFESNARAFMYSNYEFMEASGGIRIARNADQLIKYINMYLKNPQLDREGRKKIVAEHCGPQDGKAGERIGKFILDCLKLYSK